MDAAEDVQHALMLRLLFYTGVRVSELCSIEVADVDLENCKVFVNQGKGARTATSCSASPSPRRCAPTSPPIRRTAGCSRPGGAGSSRTRRVQQVVKLYAEKAGVNATPHTFRHQAITWLTKQLGHGGCRAAAHHRACPAGDAGDLPARRRGRAAGGQVPGGDEGGGTMRAVSMRRHYGVVVGRFPVRSKER